MSAAVAWRGEPVTDAVVVALRPELATRVRPVLPDAAAWHQTPFVRQLIADMRELDAISDRLNDRYRADPWLGTCMADVGALERRAEYAKPARYNAWGAIGEFVGRLDTARDDAIEAAVRTAYPESYTRHADAYDDFEEAVRNHLDSVTQAIDATVPA